MRKDKFVCRCFAVFLFFAALLLAYKDAPAYAPIGFIIGGFAWWEIDL